MQRAEKRLSATETHTDNGSQPTRKKGCEEILGKGVVFAYLCIGSGLTFCRGGIRNTVDKPAFFSETKLYLINQNHTHYEHEPFYLTQRC